MLKNFYFTWDAGHNLARYYVIMRATSYEWAQLKMRVLWGEGWSRHYSSKTWFDADGISRAERNGYMLLNIYTVHKDEYQALKRLSIA